MIEEEFPRLRLIDALLHQKQYEELQSYTEEQVPLGLLSPRTLSAARCIRAPATVLYLASLGVENLEDASDARRWLEVYQSIGSQIISEKLQEECSGKPLETIVKVIINQLAVDDMNLDQLVVHRMAEWHDAIECAADLQEYNALLAIVQTLVRKKIDSLAWLNIAKVLFARQDCMRKCTEVESLGKSYLLIRNHLSAHVPALSKVRSSLALFAARAFSLAECHEKVLSTAKLANLKDDRYFAAFETARALCRMQRMPEAIKQLDELVILMSQYHRNQGLPQLGAADAVVKPVVFDVNLASQALVDLQRLMHGLGKKAFLVSGTLLGFVREGQLLAHDKDIDVGIIGWEDQFDIAKALMESGQFSMNLDRLKGKRSYHLAVTHVSTAVHIDIFVYHPEDGKLVTGVESNFGYLQKFAFSPFGLKSVRFLGADFYIPDDAEKKLEENFGNWRDSDPCYISHLESPSTVDVGGDVYQVVARLRALEAMAEGNINKLSRVVHLMESMSGVPLSMKGWALLALKSYLKAQEAHEVAHAA